MAYDEGLAERIRESIRELRDASERRMFGGIAFLLGGRMFVGIVKDALMVRVGVDAHPQALARPHVRPMDFTGRPMQGYVFVDPPGYEDDAALERWIQDGLAHARALGPKAGA